MRLSLRGLHDRQHTRNIDGIANKTMYLRHLITRNRANLLFTRVVTIALREWIPDRPATMNMTVDWMTDMIGLRFNTPSVTSTMSSHMAIDHCALK